jgi:hypothetical protein
LIAKLIGTRSPAQVKSHGQKYMIKQKKAKLVQQQQEKIQLEKEYMQHITQVC